MIKLNKIVQSVSVLFNLNFTCLLIIVDFPEPRQEVFEYEHNEQSWASEHKVSLGHVIFSQFLVDYDVVIVLVCFNCVEIVNEHILGVYSKWKSYQSQEFPW